MPLSSRPPDLGQGEAPLEHYIGTRLPMVARVAFTPSMISKPRSQGAAAGSEQVDGGYQEGTARDRVAESPLK